MAKAINAKNMSERRKFINLALGTGALGASTAFSAVSEDQTTAKVSPPRGQKRGGNYFPNEVVYDQHGSKFRLYDDLIKNRVVLINFMTIVSHGIFPVSEHLLKIAALLGDKLGQKVFIFSITTDPKNDTVTRLKHLADDFSVKPGWHFLTTNNASEVERVSQRLYRNQGSYGCGDGHPIRMIHYGNDAIGVWGAFAADCNPELVLERLSWIQPRSKPLGLKRRGPKLLDDQETSSHNRIV
ncbi:SCO family protein [Pseudomonadota bacterium]